MMRTFSYTVGEEEHSVQAWVSISGGDITVVAAGGTRHHIGAISVAISHPSLKNPSKNTSYASVITIPGHKEDEIVRSAALDLARALDTTVVVIAGLHIDNANHQDIRKLIKNFHKIISTIQENLAEVL